MSSVQSMWEIWRYYARAVFTETVHMLPAPLLITDEGLPPTVLI